MRIEQKIALNLILLTSFLGFKQSLAQEYNFKHISVNEGLSQSAVLSLAQDDLGYIWVGTADGLNRYNGYEFIHFRNRPGEPKSISDNFIYCIETTKNGDLWVGTFGGGLNYFNAANNTFTRFKASGNKGSLHDNDIYSICQLDTILLVGTNSGLNVSYDQKTFEYIYFPDSTRYTPNDIKILDNGDILIAHDKGLSKWHIGQKYLEQLTSDTEYFKKNEHTVFCIFQIDNGDIWVGTDKGVYVMNEKYELINRLNPEAQYGNESGVTSIFQDNEGNIWVGTNGAGISIYNPKTALSRQLAHDDFDDFSLSDGTITDVIQDRSGVVWIGTYHGGINIYDRFINQFRLYQHKRGNPQSLVEPRVFAILENEIGDVWVGTDGGGIDYIDHQFDKNGNIISVIYQNDKNPLPNHKIWVLETDGSNGLWVGSTDSGLFHFNPETNELKNWRQDSTASNGAISDNSVYSLMLDSDSNLWIGTDIGINFMNLKTGSVTQLSLNPDDERIFSSNTVLAIEEDARGNIWLGTFGGGITVVDKTLKVIEKFSHSEADTNSLSYDKIMSIYKDDDGKIWIGTFGGGFNIYDLGSRKFRAYIELDGLPNDVVYGFLKDKSGYMWMSTNNGLSAFNVETGHFRNFDASCNLQSNEFNQGAYFKGNSGRFYFGGIDGMNSFKPDEISINHYKPPVIINAYSSPGELIIPKLINGIKTVELSYEKNNVFFDFVAFNYVNAHLNQYRYTLIGLNDEWVEAGSKRNASFTNLDPGTYTFKVQAANNDGVWNNIGNEVNITVLSPFYLKWWFQPVLFLSAVLLMALISILIIKTVRTNTKQQLVEADLKLAQAERQSLTYRLTSLRAQMDPHFIFNSLNSIQHFITRNDKESARVYLSKFSKLMRLILNSSREDAIALSEEIDTLKHYIDLEQLRFDHKFDYEIEIDNKIDADEVEVPTMLLQPYVENAIIHGLKNKNDEQGRLKIEFRQHDVGIKVIIEDNGIGRQKATQIRNQKLDKYKSLGMQVTQDRLQLWSKSRQEPTVTITDLFDENGKPTGTRVEVFIKVSLFD